MPVPTNGASARTKGTACRCMFEPISARLASSFSRNGISEAATETSCFGDRSAEHTSELQSLMRISYAVFCLQTKHSAHQAILLSPAIQPHQCYTTYATHRFLLCLNHNHMCCAITTSLS